ncbi:hypothetical protein HK099_008144 [Clydaea vesicula]|uniref:Uncharacterized protein n=1 Tax=Clydaea vesicula TaxID=447962 RepID=A0AAD5TVN7_9FUNG|nr:hypothetical protein HK099_008144 [Clydaea vesicula]
MSVDFLDSNELNFENFTNSNSTNDTYSDFFPDIEVVKPQLISDRLSFMMSLVFEVLCILFTLGYVLYALNLLRVNRKFKNTVSFFITYLTYTLKTVFQYLSFAYGVVYDEHSIAILELISNVFWVIAHYTFVLMIQKRFQILHLIKPYNKKWDYFLTFLSTLILGIFLLINILFTEFSGLLISGEEGHFFTVLYYSSVAIVEFYVGFMDILLSGYLFYHFLAIPTIQDTFKQNSHYYGLKALKELMVKIKVFWSSLVVIVFLKSFILAITNMDYFYVQYNLYYVIADFAYFLSILQIAFTFEYFNQLEFLTKMASKSVKQQILAERKDEFLECPSSNISSLLVDSIQPSEVDWLKHNKTTTCTGSKSEVEGN